MAIGPEKKNGRRRGRRSEPTEKRTVSGLAARRRPPTHLDQLLSAELNDLVSASKLLQLAHRLQNVIAARREMQNQSGASRKATGAEQAAGCRWHPSPRLPGVVLADLLDLAAASPVDAYAELCGSGGMLVRMMESECSLPPLRLLTPCACSPPAPPTPRFSSPLSSMSPPVTPLALRQDSTT